MIRDTHRFALLCGLIAVIIGLIAFILNWYFWDVWEGPLAGYNILLFAGNLSLVYVWHPLFSEEIALHPKLALLLMGQFVIVTVLAMLIRSLFDKLSKSVKPNSHSKEHE